MAALLGSLSRLFVLLCVCGGVRVGAICPPNTSLLCRCNDLPSGLVNMDCNSVAVSAVVEQIRDEGLQSQINQLTFVGSPDTVLLTGTFGNFSELRVVRLSFSPLSAIHPGAFSALPRLQTLDLRDNSLEWLEADMFSGVSSPLLQLLFDRNNLHYLRSDLEPLFSSVVDQISLAGNSELNCDCHLQWLVDFIARTAPALLELGDTTCSGSGSPITSPGVDFSSDCQDVCTLGFHNCDVNARCSPQSANSSTDALCTCDDGYTGDGISCSSLCADLTCDPNSLCAGGEEGGGVCVCGPGFVGSGDRCVSEAECRDVCRGENMACVIGELLHCTCLEGFVLQDSNCVEPQAAHNNVTCSGEDNYQFTWPDTTAGTTVFISCTDINNAAVNGTRQCGEDGLWGEFITSQCVSDTVLELRDALLELVVNGSSGGSGSLANLTEQLLQASLELTFAGDVPEIVDLLGLAVDAVASGDNSVSPDSFGTLVTIGSELLEMYNHPLWFQLTETQVGDSVVSLFRAMDELGEAIFSQTTESVNFTSNNIAMLIFRPECGENDTVVSGDVTVSSNLLESDSQGGSSLKLPPSIFADAISGSGPRKGGEGGERSAVRCSEVGVIAVVYDGAGPLVSIEDNLIPRNISCDVSPPPLAHGQCPWYESDAAPCPTLRVNSVIISAIIVVSNDSNQTVDTSALSAPIIITLEHDNTSLTGPTCAFLNEQDVDLMNNDEVFQTDGCGVVEGAGTANSTVCECFHLTSFALLLSPTGPPAPNQPLQIVSKIGLCISIICLLITIILLFTLKLEGKLHQLHRQLALALFLAQLLFLVAVDRTQVPSPDALCTTIAALLHYLFLCTFAWQLVEGVHLYLYVVVVFFNDRIMWAYYPLAWGLPLVVVAITLGVRFCDYGSQYYCWITTGNGTNWAFHGPVLAILAINLIIMVIVTVVIIRATKKKSGDTCLICTLFHASAVLLPILGLTWALGFFVVGDTVYAEVVEWLFCIFTTLQGVMIFVMHCIVNRDVRKAFLKACGCHEAAKKQERLLSSSSHRPSTASLGSLVRRTFSRTRRVNVEDITSFQIDMNSSTSSFTVAMPASNTRHFTNPSFALTDIEEELEGSLPGSEMSTPDLSFFTARRSSGPPHTDLQEDTPTDHAPLQDSPVVTAQ